MKIICPNSKRHCRFVTTAHEVHTWVVSQTGDFVKDLRCIDVSHLPEKGDLFTCKTCGAEAKVED